MVKWTAERLRKSFFDYFGSKEIGHKIYVSSSVVPSSDPTLLFTNSGMVPFKEFFIKSDVKRACSIQHCIRAGGKHNDLDDVGKDTYHHTFFEMMGNWSFNDYGKKEAIKFAFDYLVDVLGLDVTRIYVTYYKSEDYEDYEAKDIWSGYFEKERILPFEKENFWEMGPSGPCGPCTEIHYDLYGVKDARELVNKDDPGVIEIWNIVFMGLYKDENGIITELATKNIDTGMGFERVLGVLNNTTNYCTDVFEPLMKSIYAELIGTDERIRYLEKNMYLDVNLHQKAGISDFVNELSYQDGTRKIDVTYRVISDHARFIAACLHYNVQFGSSGRNYVFRRVFRRCLKYIYDLFGDTSKGLVQKFVCVAAKTLGFGDLRLDAIIKEENAFLNTLSKGVKLIDKLLVEENLTELTVWNLYDTHGFPIELSLIIAEEHCVKICKDKLDEVMKSRNISTKSKTHQFRNDMLSAIPVTDDSFKYLTTELDAHVTFCHNNIIVLDRTCFYAECGGQVGDTGLIVCGTAEYHVIDTQRIGLHVLHYLKDNVHITTGSRCKLAIEVARRNELAKSHTATHILNHFLGLLGSTQQGSLVLESELRFDYLINGDIDLNLIENRTNLAISLNYPVFTEVRKFCDIDSSKIKTLSDESYPDDVRVVSFGSSSELCGGTHCNSTGEINQFVLINDCGVSSNVRRLTAFVGEKAQRAIIRGKSLARYYNSLVSPGNSDIEKFRSECKDIPLFMRIEIEKRLYAKVKEAMTACKLIIKKYQEFIRESKGNFLRVEIIDDCELSTKDINKIASTLEKCNKNGVIMYSRDRLKCCVVRSMDGDSILKKELAGCKDIRIGGGNNNWSGSGTIIPDSGSSTLI